MRKSAPIEVVVHYPKTKEGWDELGKRVATAHANYVIEKITVRPLASTDPELFRRNAEQKGHQLKEYRYYDGDTLCTVILTDLTAEQICIENKVDEILDTAFGVNETPSWEDFLAFLADRCIPKTRKGLDYYLDAVGVPEYDPVLLVEKTQGRMAEDHKWLEII